MGLEGIGKQAMQGVNYNSVPTKEYSNSTGKVDRRLQEMQRKIAGVVEQIKKVNGDKNLSEEQKTKKIKELEEQLKLLNEELQQYQMQKQKEEVENKAASTKQNGGNQNAWTGVIVSISSSKEQIDSLKKSKADLEEKRSSDYLSSLQKKFPNLSLEEGVANWLPNNKTNNVIIHPSLLKEMAGDSEKAKEYMQRLGAIESTIKWAESMEAGLGFKCEYRVFSLDEKGELRGGAIVERVDKLNEKLRKEADENFEKRIQKSQENAIEKRKESQEELAESESIEEKVNTPLENIIVKMQEAVEQNGKVLFDEKEIEIMMKEYTNNVSNKS